MPPHVHQKTRKKIAGVLRYASRLIDHYYPSDTSAQADRSQDKSLIVFERTAKAIELGVFERSPHVLKEFSDPNRYCSIDKSRGKTAAKNGRPVKSTTPHFFVTALALYSKFVTGDYQWALMKRWLNSLFQNSTYEDILAIVKPGKGKSWMTDPQQWFEDNVAHLTAASFLALDVDRKAAIEAAVRSYVDYVDEKETEFCGSRQEFNDGVDDVLNGLVKNKEKRFTLRKNKIIERKINRGKHETIGFFRPPSKSQLKYIQFVSNLFPFAGEILAYRTQPIHERPLKRRVFDGEKGIVMAESWDPKRGTVRTPLRERAKSMFISKERKATDYSITDLEHSTIYEPKKRAGVGKKQT